MREAAVETLSVQSASFAVPVIAARLLDDRWPMVRAAAADALAHHGPSPVADRALGEALDDASRSVKIPVLRAIGIRHAVQYAERIRGMFAEDPLVEVRAASAATLGLLCDTESTEALTRYALAVGDPMAPAADRAIGGAALVALGQLRPADLRQRLAPLLVKGAPVDARTAAERVLAGTGGCRR